MFSATHSFCVYGRANANVYDEGANVYDEGANVYDEGANVYDEGANAWFCGGMRDGPR